MDGIVAMPFITTEDGSNVDTPDIIMSNWCFRVLTCAPRVRFPNMPRRHVTFTEPEIIVNGTRRFASDEDLDSVAFPHHILILGSSSQKTLEKEPGETFSNREVLSALLEMGSGCNHSYFRGLVYERNFDSRKPRHGMYRALWSR